MNGIIRLAGVVKESYTDGVGIRYTIFMQGCKHGCHNCQNPETWDFEGGYNASIPELVTDILEDPLLDGITLSGGDPMYQPNTVLELINELRNRNSELTVWLYTGFTYEDCLADPDKLEVLKHIDILVDGPYQDNLRALHLRFRGSSNQRIIDVKESLKQQRVILSIDDK